MQISKLIPAALAALTITGFAASANAAPSADGGDFVTRAVPMTNGPHETFVRLVKVPAMQAVANAARPMMQDPAACNCMSGEPRGAAQAPKG